MSERVQEPLSIAELALVEKPEMFSQTALSRFDVCPRSAFLYWKHRGGPQNAAMVRGEIFHQFVEQSVEFMRDNAEVQMPPEVAKDRIMGLIRERKDIHLPEYEQNACRLMAWNWGEATVIDPEDVVGLEQMIELDVGKWTIRGKLDFAEIGPLGALIRDYKTSIALPSQDEIEHGAASFQGRFYALLLLFGIPEGETFPLGKGLEEVRVQLAYPRYLDSESGALVGRDVVWTRDHVTDFRHSIEGYLEAIDHGFASGEFPAQAGSHCQTCPARDECPLPESAHQIARIDTAEEAAQALELHFTRDAVQRKLMKSVSAFHEDYGEPIYMGDYVYDRRLEVRRKVDWEAVENGIVRPEQISVVRSTPFKKRKITAEEREERDD